MNLAFLSYSHHDAKVAQWLQRSLEHYHLPSNMANPINPQSRYLRPIFRDRTDLSTGVLSEIIDKNLEESKFLIVICSRRAARSEWVSKEVQYFIEHGRMNQIIPLVIDGIPYSGGTRECMPKYMCEYVAEHPNKELLCIDRVAEGDNRAFMQIVSRLVDVPFDVMYGRHRRRRRLILSSQLAGVGLGIGVAGFFVTPISPSVQIQVAKTNLTQDEGVLSVNGQVYHINNYDTIVELPSLPGYLRGSSLDVMFAAPFYDTINEQIDLGFGLTARKVLTVKRNDWFAVFAGTVMTEEGDPISGASVKLAGLTTETDEMGNFYIVLPDEVQREYQSILVMKDGYDEFYREDECPSKELKYIMHRVR